MRLSRGTLAADLATYASSLATDEHDSRDRAADEFAAGLEPHRAELRVHCYRMLGSVDEAEDLVQETFLRAWRARESFTRRGAGALRAWLYRIATNACLDVVRQRPRRLVPQDLGAAAAPDAELPPPAELPWLQPFPNRLLEAASPREDEPDAVAAARETIELAFIAAIQHLPPRQRAALLCRDVLGWSAAETAELLEISPAAANSALQRARETLRRELGSEPAEWSRPADPSAEELELLRRYIEAHENADIDGFAAVLREDAVLTMPPHPVWFDGREAIVAVMGRAFADPEFGQLRAIATAANGQPAAAWYLRAPGAAKYRSVALDVLRIDGGAVAGVSTFASPELFERFGLPSEL